MCQGKAALTGQRQEGVCLHNWNKEPQMKGGRDAPSETSFPGHWVCWKPAWSQATGEVAGGGHGKALGNASLACAGLPSRSAPREAA